MSTSVVSFCSEVLGTALQNFTYADLPIMIGLGSWLVYEEDLLSNVHEK
jgi:hypothetical protein